MNETTKTIRQSVLQRIQEDRVKPKSAWHFAVREAGVAFIWLLSISVGAIAVAVSMFAYSVQRYALYEATHERWLDALISQLPILWILSLAGSLLLAMYHLQHFRRGYRYPLWQLLISSALASVVFGVMLHVFGAGHMVDDMMGQRMPMYMSLLKQEQSLWQQPMEGRLVGRKVYSTIATTSTIIFEDIDGVRWQMNIAELRPGDMALLDSEDFVRVLGFGNNQLVHSFHACGAFAWLRGANMTSRALSDERDAFVRRIYRHTPGVDQAEIVTEAILLEDTSQPRTQGRCQAHPAVKRLNYYAQ